MIKEIIKIETTSDGRQAVSARELHKFLESKQEFAHWIKNRITKYDFMEIKITKNSISMWKVTC